MNKFDENKIKKKVNSKACNLYGKNLKNQIYDLSETLN